MTYYSTWDIETVNWIDIVAIGYYSPDTVAGVGIVTTPGEMLDIMEAVGGDWFAHAAGLFDNKFLLGEILDRYNNAQVKIKLIQNKPGHIDILKVTGEKWFTLRDSFYLLPQGLKSLSESFGLVETKMNIDRKKIGLYSKETIKNYVISDCRILYNILKVVELSELNFDLNNITLSQTVFKNWKAKFISKNEFNNLKISARFDERFRPAFYGGRVEVFKRCGYGLNYYDINSMYPAVMLESDFPTGTPIYTKKYKPKKLGIYWAKIFIPESVKIPPIPYRDPKTNKILFPVGEFTVMLTSVELELVHKVGGSFVIIEGYYWFEKSKPFVDYVQYYYNIKKKNKGNAKYILSKLFLNSLYGKMAQRRVFKNVTFKPPKTVEELIDKEYSIIYSDRNIDSLYEIVLSECGKIILTYNEDSKIPYTLLHIGLFITSYARIKLFNAMNDILKVGGVVYYCDTDSIITDVNIKTSKKLGEFDIENKTGRIKRGYFISPKLYCLEYSNGEIEKRGKGVDSSLLSLNDFKSLLKGGTVKNFRTSLMGFLEGFRRGEKFLAIREMEKIVTGNYDKRILKNNSIDTTPRKIYNTENLENLKKRITKNE